MSPDDQPARTGALSLDSEVGEQTRTLRLAGELDLAGAPELEAAIEEALADPGRAIVVDFGALTFIDSTGIAILVAAMGDPRAAGRLRFVPSTAPAVARVLKLTGVEARMPLA